ncbi:MAG TPA: SH3 domain-containing protein [Ohtaekwangia sp.]|uniref:SH3 domain-containing protein n=1 Tax=Ohtaekwangia sp. TaxID=2066019 RepID=UPI002F92E0E1
MGRVVFQNKVRIKNYLLFLPMMLCLLKFSNAQKMSASKLVLMQGTWENIMNSDSEKAFTIIKGKSSLSFVYNTSAGLDFPLTELIEGFYDGSIEDDSIDVTSLKDDGVHYIVIRKNDIESNGWVYRPNYLTPGYFDCDGELMSINGGQLVEYSKMDELPFEALDKLFKRGRLDKRDYIKEYLDLRVLSVRPLKGKVYSSPNKQTEVFLNQDDIVIVIEENNKWAKIKYSEGEGWVRKGNLK